MLRRGRDETPPSAASRKRGLQHAACLIGALALAALAPLEAAARGLIRDSEIERTLQRMLDPILTAAGESSDRVRLYVLNDSSLNAFVSAGTNMVFHTGLIRELEAPEELIGVMAHEVGHVAARHYSRRVAAIEAAQDMNLLATIAGIGAGLAGGGGAGLGVAQGGSRIATRQLLRATRGQELGADSLGVDYMNRIGVDPEAMFIVLRRLGERIGPIAGINPYAQTHPLTGRRIEALRQKVATSPARGQRVSADMRYWHARMRAKLDGFLSAPGSSATVDYGDPELDLYREAIALHRAPRPDAALDAVERLIAMRPQDPFYWELKGQILSESGRGPQAVAPLEKAMRFAPDEPLIALALGDALLTKRSPEADARALPILERAAVGDRFNPGILRSLADAYGRVGKEGMALLATAERLAMIGRIPDAHRQARFAQTKLPAGSPGWLRAEDVLNIKT
ncbi:MAG: M48 family metalloprotease, partial [Pseudomonadota bacterium]